MGGKKRERKEGKEKTKGISSLFLSVVLAPLLLIACVVEVVRCSEEEEQMTGEGGWMEMQWTWTRTKSSQTDGFAWPTFECRCVEFEWVLPLYLWGLLDRRLVLTAGTQRSSAAGFQGLDGSKVLMTAQRRTSPSIRLPKNPPQKPVTAHRLPIVNPPSHFLQPALMCLAARPGGCKSTINQCSVGTEPSAQ